MGKKRESIFLLNWTPSLAQIPSIQSPEVSVPNLLLIERRFIHVKTYTVSNSLIWLFVRLSSLGRKFSLCPIWGLPSFKFNYFPRNPWTSKAWHCMLVNRTLKTATINLFLVGILRFVIVPLHLFNFNIVFNNFSGLANCMVPYVSILNPSSRTLKFNNLRATTT